MTQVVRRERKLNAHIFLMGKHLGKCPLGMPRKRYEVSL
jgi:hypothetical protein